MSSNIYKQSGSKNWHLSVTIDGVRHRESLRTTSKRVAEKKAKSRIEELQEKARKGENDWLFQAGFVKFYDGMDQGNSSWSAETIKRYRTSLRSILGVLEEYCEDEGDDVSDLMAMEIDRAVVSEFVERRKDQGVTVATINRDLTAFWHLMSVMKNDGWILDNPVASYERQGMKEVLPDIVMPTDTAIEELASRAPGTLSEFPGFLNETGGRVKETAMIKWSDIKGMEKPVEGKVKVTYRNTKGGKIRVITLRQGAIDILLRIPRSNSSPYLFWNRSDHGYYKDASNLFWEYGQETGFGSRLHDIRHKFAIERLQEGWSIYRVSRYIGHVSVRTTERYYFRYLTQEEQDAARSDGDNGFR
ncbi:tyrosine-type recombinase/integrase [Ruegeria sp. MALMAid1280]|uniref:tyrosine-type recombinase/integrase n=1 Tax=Ruegeria sp. MALMAid1280 TaxID=3411634 RepID=UPI003BA332F1